VGEDHRAGRGGITSLAAFLEEHSEAVEADLARFYPAEDLRELFRPGGRLTYRRLGVLLAHLPLEAATQTLRLAELSDEDYAELASPGHRHGPWSHTDLLLAAVADAIERLTFVQLSRAGTKPKQPQPIPRPGVRSNVRPINPAARAYLERIREQHRQRQEA
jgi:hypothetical protein